MKRKLMYAAIVSAMLAGCSNEDAPVAPQKTGTVELGVSAGISGVVDTRATAAGIIGGTAFATGENISVFVTGTSYPQTIATYTLGSPWTSGTNKIYLSNEPATVYGYYPATATAATAFTNTDANKINISLPASESSFTGAGQTDFMYVAERSLTTNSAGPQETVSNAKDKDAITLKFKHAFAKLSFVINKTASYSGTGNLTNVELASTNGFFAGNGTLALKDGALAWTNVQTVATSISFANATSITIGADGNLTPNVVGLVAPRTNQSATYATDHTSDITLKLTIDSKVMSVTLPINSESPYVGNAWVAGNNYQYTITVQGTELKVSSVALTDWVNVPVGTAPIN
jgi:hypothetical protein